MRSPPRCFCGRPSAPSGGAFRCAAARCPFSARAAPGGSPRRAASPRRAETCAGHAEPVETVTLPAVAAAPPRVYTRCARPPAQRCAHFRLVHAASRAPPSPPARFGGRHPPAAPPRVSVPAFRKDAPDARGRATCRCGEAAARRVARRDGPNQGRAFFVCPRPEQCGFFQWEDEEHAAEGGASCDAGAGLSRNRRPANASAATPPHVSPPARAEPSSAPLCLCDVQAVERTVRKQGPNHGKRFYVCDKPPDQQCGFFEWGAEQPPAAGGLGFGHSDQIPAATANGNVAQPTAIRQPHIVVAEPEEETPRCRCGTEAVRRTVRKPGPNRGKDFFVCEKQPADQCGFFEWAKSRPHSAGSATSGQSKRAAEREQRGADAAPVEKRPRVAPKGKVALELHEIDSLTFKLHLTMPSELRDAVKRFSQAKVAKTNMLGVEDVVISLDALPLFEQYLSANAATKVECNVPEKVRNRISQYLAAEKRREDSGDIVTRPLDELLPSIICEKLMEFQWHGVHFALKRGGRCLIGDDMGLGKTLQAIAVARIYMSDWPLLIVCPSSLRLNWKEELLRWLEEDLVEEDILVIMSGKDIDRPLRRVSIVSYDLVRKIPQRSLKRFRFIIADESHYLKTGSAKRSKVVLPLIKKAKRALLLSGTPALSRPVELFPQINSILPALFPNYNEYVERYCAAHQGYFGYDVSGASNLSELHTLLRGSLLIRRKKEEVLTQLPDKQRQVLWMQTSTKIMKAVARATEKYEAAKDAANEAASEEHASVLQNAVKAAQNELYSLTVRAKLDSILEVCKDTSESGCKFIVFGHHADAMDAMHKYLTEKLKLGVIRIDGSTPQGARQGLCKTFQTDRKCRVALLSITAAGVGLTLTEATVVLFAELYWNPGSLLQAEDRAHRIGQKDCVLVKYLLARNTLDESMWSTVRRKLNVVGHSLTGAAARMDLTEDKEQPAVPPRGGGIERFFQRKSREHTSPQSSQPNTQPTPDELTRGDDVIEEDDGDESRSVIPTPADNTAARLAAQHQDSEITFPTSLRVQRSPLTSNGLRCERLRGYATWHDLTEPRKRQEQIDQDIALARKLQAQFDAEDAGF